MQVPQVAICITKITNCEFGVKMDGFSRKCLIKTWAWM